MPSYLARTAVALSLAALVSVLAGCGGGGGEPAAAALPPAGGAGAPPPAQSAWTPGVYQPSPRFAAQCTLPRAGIDPGTGMAYPDVQGNVLAENQWLRSWSRELYLWYDEIADVDPGNHTTSAYFDQLRTFATTPSGNPKDRFHFTMPTSEWQALAQSGTTYGYGAEWAVLDALPPRHIVVAYTQPESAATAANLGRGAKVLEVDGIDVVNADTQASVDVMVAGLFPDGPDEPHVFTIQDPGAANARTVTLQSQTVTIAPVQHVDTFVTPTGTVGYLSFTDHLATAEQALIDAIVDLRSANVTDLVLDLRYNGGGFLDIASELAYMIAGAARTGGQTFEALRFNDQHPSTNPVTGTPLSPVPFHSVARGFSAPAGQALPTLDLARVFVLTGATTCSASESIMNALGGIGVEVIQIGSTTCGKPYGFYPADNCGTTYFSIQFKGVNAQGFGDYTDGFSPANTPGVLTAPLPGCSAADDFSHALGDPLERRLATALAYRDGEGCPALAGSTKQSSKAAAASVHIDGIVPKSPWLTNRSLGSP